MMRFILLSTLICWSSMVFGQILPQYYDTIEHNQVINLNGSVDYAGNAIQKEITKAFYRGGSISNDMKDHAFNKHRGVNRFGGEASTDLSYSNYNIRLLKNKPWGMRITAGAYYFGGMLYSQDLFGLGFYGNERYIGDTIDLSGTDVSFTAFQKIGFGLIDSKSKSSLTFNIYNVSDRISADFRETRMIQSADSNSIELIMDGDVEMGSSKQFNQGIGFGLDFDYYLNIDWQSGRSAFIHFSVKNVGFAYLYEDQKRYSFDTTFTYNGLSFSEITGQNSILQDSLDVLDTLGITSNMSNPTILLPGYIQIAKIVDEHQTNKFQSFFGIRMYPTLIYSPYVFGGIDFKVNDWFRCGVMASYGGFTNFKGGIYAGMKKGKFAVGLSTENILGMVSKNGSGESFYINLRCDI